MRQLSASTTLAITNPLTLYRSLVATQQIEPDPAQHRLAIHLQNVHKRLKDYTPEFDFRERLQHIRSIVADVSALPPTAGSRTQNEGTASRGLLSAWRQRSKQTEAMALTRSLTDHTSAAALNSPQGLLLHGEVGTGKSLLSQLLSDCLPGDKIRRWHFNTFMLSMYAKIEKLRKARLAPEHDEYALLRVSRDLIFQSPILFIDEFQFPDRAASKILSNLLTSFFQLGGVLIATSNRMPEQLADAAGSEFNASGSRHHGKQSKLDKAESERERKTQRLSGGDFDNFLELLQARCEIWNIEGTRDWRRREALEDEDRPPVKASSQPARSDLSGLEELQPSNLSLGFEQSRGFPIDIEASNRFSGHGSRSVPRHYFVKDKVHQFSEEQQQKWQISEHKAMNDTEPNIIWQPNSVNVYSRSVLVPRQHNGVSKWTFDELCTAQLGPADYITLASCYHTFIVIDVPILTVIHKNEARRFITLLDALYEARCRLLISAHDNPDHILFPERNLKISRGKDLDDTEADSVYAETFSEIHQDQTVPFRPNVAAYSPSASTPDYPTTPMPSGRGTISSLRSILADEDSDFGPVYGAGRHHGQAEQNNEMQSQERILVSEPDFSRAATFTGQDELFAYKRAQSRLWEMCGERWWSKGIKSWHPLSKDARHWEHSALQESMPSSVKDDQAVSPTQDAFLVEGSSPFRRNESTPPKFSWTHAWGMALWGKKAGIWGLGPQGLADRKKPVK